MKDDERESKEEVLADYVLTTKGIHREWALQCIGAQFLYLVNVIGQIFFVDCFLGWEFTKYGMAAAAFSDLDVSNFRIELLIEWKNHIKTYTKHKNQQITSRYIASKIKLTFESLK